MKSLIVLFTLMLAAVANAAQAPYPANLPQAGVPLGHITVSLGGYNLGDGGVPSGVGNTTGPTGAIDGDAPAFNGTTGILLKDAGAPPAFAVADVAALAARSIAPLNLGVHVRVNTFSASRATDAPPIDYVLTSVACTVDSVTCFLASGSTTAWWRIAAQPEYDLRNFGAYGDITPLYTTAAVVSSGGVCTITFGVSNLVSTDAGKNITITNGSSNTTIGGATYAGTISTVVSATSITVPNGTCPTTITNSIAQDIRYGHLDAAAMNLASQFLDRFPQITSAQTVLTGGGRGYGLESPFHETANAAYNNFYAVAMVPSGFGPNDAVCSYEASFLTSQFAVCDSNYMPINAISATTNGTILLGYQRALNWYGNTSNTVTFTGAHSTVAGTATGAISGCVGNSSLGWTCNLAVSVVATGNIQPGWTVTGTSVPDGSWVAQYGDKATSGDKGNYTIFNPFNNPGTIGSEALTFLGPDVVVNACGTANFNSIGLFSYGNASKGVANGRIIAACNTGTSTITLNGAPTKAFSAQTLTFAQQPNGIYAPLGAANVGIQFDRVTSDWNHFKGDPANQSGCAVYDDSAGGSAWLNVGLFQGRGGICRGPDAAGGVYKGGVHISNLGANCCEMNSPAIIEMDGADNANYENILLSGQFQKFVVNLPTTLSLQMDRLGWNPNLGSVGYAPSNRMFFYTETAATSLNKVMNYDGLNVMIATAGQPSLPPSLTLVALKAAGGSYAEYTPAQINLMSLSQTVMLANSNNPLMIPQGLDLATSPLDHAEDPVIPIAAAYTLTENDCGRYLRFNSPSYTVTASNTLGQNSGKTLSASSCNIHMFAPITGITLTVGSGATVLYNRVSQAGPITLKPQTRYDLDCPANGTGMAAVCYLYSRIADSGSGYSVSQLNAIPLPLIGDRAYVTDATACAFNSAPTGGGSTFCPVVYNGSSWLEH